jgi:hypothetical protein
MAESWFNKYAKNRENLNYQSMISTFEHFDCDKYGFLKEILDYFIISKFSIFLLFSKIV